MRRSSRGIGLSEAAAASGLVILALLAGCGGGVASQGGGPGPAPVSDPATARFQVDVTTGQVSVQPLSASSRAVLTGTAVTFNSSTLIDEPGNTGRKVLSVSLTNRRNEPIGVNPDGVTTGLNVVFGNIVNVGALSDVRPLGTVRTVAGTGIAGNADGPVGSATLNAPTGVAVDGGGAVYVTDATGNRVRKIANGYVSTLAGSGAAGGVNGPGASASFNSPFGVAWNPRDGSLVVSEQYGQRVRRVDSAGNVSTVAGTGAAGDADGTGSVAQFRNPVGVAVDNDGVIYVAEYGGHRIRRILWTGEDPGMASSYLVGVYAGSPSPSPGSTDGVAGLARFNGPVGVCVDSSGIVYVADAINNRVRRVTPSGDVTTVAGTGAASEVDGAGDVATLKTPWGIAWSNGCLIVSDYAGHTLRQVRLNGSGTASPALARSWLVQTLAGLASTTGSADGAGDVARFTNPRLVYAAASGDVYVGAGGNQTVRKVTPMGGHFPVGVAAGGTPASEPVQLYNADGVVPNTAPVRRYVRYPGSLAPGQTSGAKPWVFVVPEGVTAFEFVVRVEADTAYGAPVDAVSNPGPSGAGSPNVMVSTVAGSPPETGFVNGPAAIARFLAPADVAVDSAGNVYVADSGIGSIRRISANGMVATIAGIEGTGLGTAVNGSGMVARFYRPKGLDVTADGTVIYVADSYQVRRIALSPGADPADPANWTVTTIAGALTTSGKDNGRGDVATFCGLSGIAIDPGGGLYVTELQGNRVRRVSFRGGDPSLSTNWWASGVAGDFTAVFGAPGTTDGVGGDARFNGPAAIAVDRTGALYVADALNHRIRKVGSDGLVSTLAGPSGSAVSYDYADGDGPLARFHLPYGIAVDASGYLYVSDLSNRRVRRVSPSGLVTTVAGTGAGGRLDGLGSASTFQNCNGLCVDGVGTVYVADEVAATVRAIRRIIGEASP